MWAYESVFYQIYPIGFCGAPKQNDGECVNRIKKVGEWADHMADLGIGAVYFSPVFESDSHGYDTRNFGLIDCRLGSNEDFAEVCKKLHQKGIRVVLDGVFNHVGRGFWAFQDVLKNRESSPYKDWFFIDFGGNSGYNDGFYYQGWEGHYELVKLNLRNEDVINHIFYNISEWVKQFDIDGLRLDVAYCLDKDFLRRLRGYTDTLKPDFLLVGEAIHGDYNQLLNAGLHSVTNYECYKGLYSSFNSMNMFEIQYSLERQFDSNHGIYKGSHLLCFADNHDVNRLASTLTVKQHLPLEYSLLLSMPGIPCIYYGSEWGAEGKKEHGSDDNLRPCFEAPEQNELTKAVAKMAKVRAQNPALSYGSYKKLFLTNKQLAFERNFEDNRIFITINAEDKPFKAQLNGVSGMVQNLLTGETADFSGGYEMPAYSTGWWKTV